MVKNELKRVCDCKINYLKLKLQLFHTSGKKVTCTNNRPKKVPIKNEASFFEKLILNFLFVFIKFEKKVSIEIGMDGIPATPSEKR